MFGGTEENSSLRCSTFRLLIPKFQSKPKLLTKFLRDSKSNTGWKTLRKGKRNKLKLKFTAWWTNIPPA